MKAFTLIELIIVFALIGLLTSLGIASYSAYNGTQSVQSGAADMQNILRTAQSRAISQVKPTSCGTNPLTGYQVDITVNSQNFTLSAMCGTKQVISSRRLPANVLFANGSTTSVLFSLASGTVDTAGTIIINGYGKTKTITINKTGSVSVN